MRASSRWFRARPRRSSRSVSCRSGARGSASSPDVPTVGGTKNVDVDARRRARARPRGRERRGEPHRGRATRSSARGLALHSMSPRSVADVGPAVCALPRAVGVDRGRRPFDAWDAVAATARASRRAARARSSRSGGGRGCRSRPTPTARRCSRTSASQRVRRRRRSLSRGRARRGRGARARRRPVAERAVRVRASATPSSCGTSVAGVRTTFVDGRDLFWWGIRTPAAAVRLQRVALMASVRVRIDDLERGDLPALSVKTGAVCANPVAIVLAARTATRGRRGARRSRRSCRSKRRARGRRSLTRVSWAILVVVRGRARSPRSPGRVRSPLVAAVLAFVAYVARDLRRRPALDRLTSVRTPTARSC